MRISGWSSDVCYSDLNDAADETPFACCLGIDRIAGKEELRRPAHADRAGKKPGSAVAGDKSEFQEGHAKFGLVGSEAHVGHEGDITAQADRGAVDRGDQDRKSVGWGKGVSMRVDLGGGE